MLAPRRTFLVAAICLGAGFAYEHTGHPINMCQYSEKLQQLVAEAKQLSAQPIRFEFLLAELAQIYQGRTEYEDNEIVVKIASNYPPEHAENLLAHELFHVILFAEGFPTHYGFPTHLEGTEVGRLTDTIGSKLTSCFTDALIDRRMAQRGFQPESLTRREADNYKRTARQGVSSASLREPLWRRYAALNLFCLSIRRRNFPMDEIEEAFATIDPAIVEAAQLLRAKFRNVEFNSPQLCLEATKTLRDEAGFKNFVWIVNPQIRKVE